MRANTIIDFMINRLHFQLNGFKIAKSALDKGEALISTNHVLGLHLRFVDISSDDITAIKAFFMRDFARIDRPDQAVLLLWMLWRSLPAALLCMIPNVPPILAIFIVMGFAGIWLDMATALIACVAMGIAVDDTIHVYFKYSQYVEKGTKPTWALVRTMRTAGGAVVATTLLLSAQFFLLMTSQFQPTANFGMLTGVGVLAALLFDLPLLPAILTLLRNAAFLKIEVVGFCVIIPAQIFEALLCRNLQNTGTYFALRASRRLFKTAPGSFVSNGGPLFRFLDTLFEAIYYIL